ncbi:MAG: hypothetical protein OJF49_001249 [Ktedonobacterales bacterium]|jgi:proteasome assembly chaperone (PAC2) family protein|nr:MAG: hypothetical protein OJF49_001249 [Ktedonobacterales bacterium]
MDYVELSEVPNLENAILIGAFAGWNDAASAASWAVKFLINHWEATAFAEIGSADFYDFTETRPRVRISNGAIRRVSWPSTRFYVHRAPRVEGEQERGRQRDVVLMLGDEPQLNWKTYTEAIVRLCQQCQVRDVVLLGALAGEVPHTAPVRIIGAASDMTVLRRMRRANVERANYEGPTGVLTVLQDSARKAGIPSASFWGTAPHYVSATPNLPVSEALLEKLSTVYHFNLRLTDLARAARRFSARVSSLVAADPEVSAYVHELEQRAPGEQGESSGMRFANDTSGVHSLPLDGELPSGEEAVRDVEEWLRQFRGEAGADS